MTNGPRHPSSDLRVGDRERAEAAESLSAHAAAGRLGIEELERRLERAHAAVYGRDLSALLADLPSASARRRVAPRLPVAALAAPLLAAPLLAAALALSVLAGHPIVPLFLLAGVLLWRAVRRPYPHHPEGSAA